MMTITAANVSTIVTIIGDLAIVLSIIGTAIGIGIKIGAVQQLVKGHTTTLNEHAKRLDRHETIMIEVVGNLQRVVGRVEATQDRLDRSTGYRGGEGRA